MGSPISKKNEKYFEENQREENNKTRRNRNNRVTSTVSSQVRMGSHFAKSYSSENLKKLNEKKMETLRTVLLRHDILDLK